MTCSHFTFNEDTSWAELDEWFEKVSPHHHPSWLWYFKGIQAGIEMACLGVREKHPHIRHVHRHHHTFLKEKNGELFAKRITMAYGKEHEFEPRKELR